MKTYKGYEIEKLTHNTYRIRKVGGSWISLMIIKNSSVFDHYPRTLKEAKAIIDAM